MIVQLLLLQLLLCDRFERTNLDLQPQHLLLLSLAPRAQRVSHGTRGQRVTLFTFVGGFERVCQLLIVKDQVAELIPVILGLLVGVIRIFLLGSGSLLQSVWRIFGRGVQRALRINFDDCTILSHELQVACLSDTPTHG